MCSNYLNQTISNRKKQSEIETNNQKQKQTIRNRNKQSEIEPSDQKQNQTIRNRNKPSEIGTNNQKQKQTIRNSNKQSEIETNSQKQIQNHSFVESGKMILFFGGGGGSKNWLAEYIDKDTLYLNVYVIQLKKICPPLPHVYSQKRYQ